MQPRNRSTRLGREELLDTALAIIDTEGLGSLTMRRLGAELRVEAMSLYAHVSSKAALLYEVVDSVFSQLEPNNGDDPIAAARGMARDFRQVLLAHPNLLPLLAAPEAGATSTGGLRALDQALGLARRLGLDAREATIAYTTVISFVVGHVITHAGALRPVTGDQAEDHHQRLRASRTALAADEFPHLVAAGGTLDVDPDESFDDGLDAVLLGILAQLEEWRSRA